MTEEFRFELYEKHVEWLKEMTATYDLPDHDKTLRVLLDFAMTEGNHDHIFTEIRCTNC